MEDVHFITGLTVDGLPVTSATLIPTDAENKVFRTGPEGRTGEVSGSRFNGLTGVGPFAYRG
ncbi:hypothetical protein LINPERHAP2_LOCUS33211 [Linum perenne]